MIRNHKAKNLPWQTKWSNQLTWACSLTTKAHTRAIRHCSLQSQKPSSSPRKRSTSNPSPVKCTSPPTWRREPLRTCTTTWWRRKCFTKIINSIRVTPPMNSNGRSRRWRRSGPEAMMTKAEISCSTLRRKSGRWWGNINHSNMEWVEVTMALMSIMWMPAIIVIGIVNKKLPPRIWLRTPIKKEMTTYCQN